MERGEKEVLHMLVGMETHREKGRIKGNILGEHCSLFDHLTDTSKM